MREAQSAIMSKFAPRSIRISVALVLAGMLIVIGSGQALGKVGLEKASTYTCDKPCYGRNQWKNTTSEYVGAYTDISIAHLQCNASCNTDGIGFIDNEIWLLDDSGGCQTGTVKRCWVEAGYMMHYGSPNEIFFSYDMRPDTPNNGSPGINTPGYILLGPVGPPPPLTPPTPTVFARSAPTPVATLPTTPTIPPNHYGHNVHFMIIKDSHLPSPSFLIFIYDDSMNSQFEVTSSPNPMMAHKVNYFAVQTLTSNNTSPTYNIQTQEGTGLPSDNPPMASWTIDPATSSDGGTFSTHCCSLP